MVYLAKAQIPTSHKGHEVHEENGSRKAAKAQRMKITAEAERRR